MDKNAPLTEKQIQYIKNTIFSALKRVLFNLKSLKFSDRDANFYFVTGRTKLKRSNHT